MVEQMTLGVSTRNYPRSLEALPEGLPAKAISKSNVSRRFVARTAKAMDEFLSRPLGELDIPVLVLDAKYFGEHMLLIALGVEHDGTKHVLGLVEGTTESERVCAGLLRNLIERGLDAERPRLVVLDGAKGLRSAVRTVLGNRALVQRCQEHKIRNVVEHLPKKKRTWVKRQLRKAYAAKTVKEARRKLLALASSLKDEHPGAAGSLSEGLDETLTIIRLGVSETLAKTLRSTNIIESLNDTLGRVSHNVKRWGTGSMAMRWAVTGFIEAKKGFRRLRGYKEMPKFLRALEREIEGMDNCARVA